MSIGHIDERHRELFAPLMVLLHSLSGAQSGIYFADLTKLAVCHNRRIHRHKVFDGLAARDKTNTGWFFGVKLHFVINHKGQIMAVKYTPGNTADSTVLDEMTSTWPASSTPTKAISVRTCSRHFGSAAYTSLLVSAGTCGTT